MTETTVDAGFTYSGEELDALAGAVNYYRWIVQRFFEATDDGNYGVFGVAGESSGFYARIQSGATDDRALSAPVLIRG
jgi:hypothetical protein